MIEQRKHILIARCKATWYSAGGRVAGAVIPDALYRVNCPDRRLFLTFDDGPSIEFTLRVSDFLKAERLKATFFARAERAIEQPEIVRLLLSAGHEIGSHSFDHSDFWRSSRSSMTAAMEKADSILSAIAGSAVRLIRPPYGHVRPALIRWCRLREKTCVLWDVMPGDFSYDGSGTRLFESIRPLLRNGSIVVLHDGTDIPKDSIDNPDESESLVELNQRFDRIRGLIQSLKSDGWAMDATIGSFLLK